MESSPIDLYLVNSVIRTAPQPLSYAIRSHFTHEQRFQQTLNTLQSIRQKNPSAYIVFIEGSSLPEEWKNPLLTKVDHYYDVSNLPHVKEAIESPAKGFGEQMKLYIYFTSEHFRQLFPRVRSITKLCGRYKLKENYIPRNDPYICIKQNDRDSMNTTWYYIPAQEIPDYILASHECIHNPALLHAQSGLEYVLFQTWLKNKKPYRTLSNIGVEGWVGPFGDYFSM